MAFSFADASDLAVLGLRVTSAGEVELRLFDELELVELADTERDAEADCVAAAVELEACAGREGNG